MTTIKHIKYDLRRRALRLYVRMACMAYRDIVRAKFMNDGFKRNILMLKARFKIYVVMKIYLKCLEFVNL